jgi:alpha-L-fucosidase
MLRKMLSMMPMLLGTANGSTHAWSYWATQGMHACIQLLLSCGITRCHTAKSWALSRVEGSDYYRKGDFFIPLLVDNIVDNGMLLLNFGPGPDGTIPAMQQVRISVPVQPM